MVVTLQTPSQTSLDEVRAFLMSNAAVVSTAPVAAKHYLRAKCTLRQFHYDAVKCTDRGVLQRLPAQGHRPGVSPTGAGR